MGLLGALVVFAPSRSIRAFRQVRAALGLAPPLINILRSLMWVPAIATLSSVAGVRIAWSQPAIEQNPAHMTTSLKCVHLDRDRRLLVSGVVGINVANPCPFFLAAEDTQGRGLDLDDLPLGSSVRLRWRSLPPPSFVAPAQAKRHSLFADAPVWNGFCSSGRACWVEPMVELQSLSLGLTSSAAACSPCTKGHSVRFSSLR